MPQGGEHRDEFLPLTANSVLSSIQDIIGMREKNREMVILKIIFTYKTNSKCMDNTCYLPKVNRYNHMYFLYKK